MELQNSTVLVTGATGNMGPYVTDALVDSGADVVGTYVTETEKEAVEESAEYADAVSYHQVDLTDQAAAEAFAETVADEHGSVDHIVGLAGGFSMGSIDDTDADAFEAALNRHATTAFLTVKAFSDHLDGRAWPVLGVHPALISRLVDEGYTPGEARDLMQAGLEVAAEFVADGEALALKSGRPHYDVSDAVWTASNEVMKHAFELGAEVDAPVQLHTESGEDFEQVAEWATERGLDAEQVVKHFAGGRVRGPVPSVIGHREKLERAAQRGEPFLMETDFIDDSDRPGAVLGPKTVPKRVRWLREAGYDRAVEIAHVETPTRVYGIDTEATLAE
jgi:TatD-related deoxyribonuclease